MSLARCLERSYIVCLDIPFHPTDGKPAEPADVPRPGQKNAPGNYLIRVLCEPDSEAVAPPKLYVVTAVNALLCQFDRYPVIGTRSVH
jgi:hypothetical protein